MMLGEYWIPQLKSTLLWSGMFYIEDVTLEVYYLVILGWKIKVNRFTGTPAFMMSSRVGIIDFCKLNTPTVGRFVFRAPQMSSVANLYTLPFDKFVWFSALLLAFLSALFIYATMVLEKRNEDRRVMKKIANIDRKTRFTDSALTIVSAICQMGPLVDPKLQSSKIIMVRTLDLNQTIFFLRNSFSVFHFSKFVVLVHILYCEYRVVVAGTNSKFSFKINFYN